MSKKEYNGLAVKFVPIDGASIITTSGKPCEVISVQYYVNNPISSECNVEGEAGGYEDDGYSYNWNSRPPIP